jgi:RNA polymerase sigma-70 factor, ECF subfamily
MTVETSLWDEMLAAIPKLRAFAMSLTNNRDWTDDLVQDTIVRAWAKIDQFERGTSLNAWLFTILHNLAHSEYRKRRREVEGADGSYAAWLRTHPDQQAHLDLGRRRSVPHNGRGQAQDRWALMNDPSLSMTEIANQLGVAPSTLYRCFPGGRSDMYVLTIAEVARCP